MSNHLPVLDPQRVNLSAPQSTPKHSLLFYPSAGPTVVGDLTTYDFAVPPDTLSKEVVDALESHPELPGVLIMDREKYIGVVSRQKCFERLGRPFGVEVFLRRPILTLFYQLNIQPAPLPANLRIEQAVQKALGRPLEELYEPVVVSYSDQDMRLLDLHMLLLSQSQLLSTANRMIQQQAEIERSLSSTLDLQQVMALILQFLAEMVPFDRAGVLLQDQNGPRYVATQGFSESFDLRGRQVSPHEQDLIEQIINTRRPMLIADVADRDDWLQVDGLPPAASWLGLPLIHSEQVIGLLSLTRTQGKPFQPEELALAQSFSGQAAIALKNASLYGEIIQLNLNLERMVQKRTVELQAAYDQLNRLDRTKSDLISAASNELRAPLSSMNRAIQSLLLDETVQNLPKHPMLVEGLLSSMARLDEIVQSMLDIAKIDRRELHLRHEPVEITSLLHGGVAEMRKVTKERKLSFKVEAVRNLPAVQADVEAFRKVVFHLLANAVKYTPDGGRVMIWARYLLPDESVLQESSVEIVVEDSGVGIAPEICARLFADDDPNGQPASVRHGLGLALVRGIVEAHQGKVWAESSGYDEVKLPGSRFHVVLPVFN